MRNNLSKITDNLLKERNVEYTTKLQLSAYTWFTRYTRKHLSSINTVNKLKQLNETQEIRVSQIKQNKRRPYIRESSLYVYNYLPKYAESLDYFDITPCVYVLSIANNGFTGLNLHYLPPSERNRLLYIIKQHSQSNELALLKLLEYLKRKYPYYNKIVKRYLYSHIMSNIQMIDDKYFPLVANLPLAKFKGVSIQGVYKNTMRKE